MTEVERLADQMVLLDKGRVVAVGPLAELQADPIRCWRPPKKLPSLYEE
jgi:ABC-type molybdate transport system ATPase subunit